MLLDRIVLSHAGPFRQLDLDLRCPPSSRSFDSQAVWPTEDIAPWIAGAAGRVSVMHGAGGTGKSLLLSALASTRPGYVQRLTNANSEHGRAAVQCHWSLGQEESNRPHPLVVRNGVDPAPGTGEGASRREQQLYDRKAGQGGFAFLIVPAHRRFGQSPIYLVDPARTMRNYEVRAGSLWLDPARADLTRPIKQILAYASLGAALQQSQAIHHFDSVSASHRDPSSITILDQALRSGLSRLLVEQALDYVGADPASFEPMFRSAHGALLRFDQLPQQARHLMAPLILAMHHFWTSGHGADPRGVQGVIALDDAELHLSEATQEFVLPRYREILPQAHWVVATTSWRIAASVHSSEVVALRQQMQTGAIAPFQGDLSVTH